jgi:hypothetical protein
MKIHVGCIADSNKGATRRVRVFPGADIVAGWRNRLGRLSRNLSFVLRVG